MYSRRRLGDSLFTLSLFMGAALLVLGLARSGFLLKSNVPLDVTFVTSIGDISSTALMLGVTAALVGSLIFYVKHRKEFRESMKKALHPGEFQMGNLRRRFTAQVAAFIVIITFTFLLAVFSDSMRRAFNTLAGVFFAESPLSNSTIPGSGGASLATSPQFILQLALSFVLLGTVVGLAGVGGYIVIGALRQVRRERGMEMGDSLESSQRSAAATILQAITALRSGGNVRDTILQCYKRMCEIASTQNVSVQEFHTPREVQFQIIEALALPAEPVTRLTELFEEARYSDHDISSVKSEKAVKLLDDIRSGLAEL